jgi:hypothetical protein
MLLLITIHNYPHSQNDYYNYYYYNLLLLLGSQSFIYCYSLSEVFLTNGLTVLGEAMFYMGGGDSSLKSIVIPSTLTSIGGLLWLLS